MTDEMENPWDRPTKTNIVRLPCEISLQPLYYFFQLREMRELVRDAQPGDSFFLYCTSLCSTYIDAILYRFTIN